MSSSDGGGSGPPLRVYQKLEETHQKVIEVDEKVDAMLRIVIRLGSHLDRVEEKVDAISTDVWKGQWELKKQIETVDHATKQVKACVGEMKSGVTVSDAEGN